MVPSTPGPTPLYVSPSLLSSFFSPLSSRSTHTNPLHGPFNTWTYTFVSLSLSLFFFHLTITLIIMVPSTPGPTYLYVFSSVLSPLSSLFFLLFLLTFCCLSAVPMTRWLENMEAPFVWIRVLHVQGLCMLSLVKMVYNHKQAIDVICNFAKYCFCRNLVVFLQKHHTSLFFFFFGVLCTLAWFLISPGQNWRWR